MESAAAYAVDFLVLLVAWFSATVAHEFGHAVAGWLVGYRVFACGTGLGRPVLRVRLLGTVWFVGLRNASAGVTFSHYPSLYVPRLREGVSLAGGVTANFLLAVATGLLLLDGVPDRWWLPVAVLCGVNAFHSVINLWPLEIRVGDARYLSDGRQILRLVTGKRWSRLAEEVTTARATGEFCEHLGETRMRRLLTTNAALVWAVLGAPARAHELLAEADEVGEPESAFDRAHRWLARAVVVSTDEEKTDEALAALASARHEFAAALDRAGMALADLTTAEIHMVKGRPEAIEEAVKAWAGEPVLRHPALARVVELLELLARFHNGEVTAADDMVEWFDGLPEPVRDPAAAMANFRRLAKVFRDRGDTENAKRLQRLALREAGRAEAGLAHPEDKDIFEGVKATMRNRLRELLAAEGIDPATEPEDTSAADARAAEERAAVARQQRRYRLAWGLLGAKVLALVSVFALVAAVVPPETDWQWWVSAVGAAYLIYGAAFTVFAFVSALVTGLVRWVRPKSAADYGTSALVMVVMAWLLSPACAAGSLWLFHDKLGPDQIEFPHQRPGFFPWSDDANDFDTDEVED